MVHIIYLFHKSHTTVSATQNTKAEFVIIHLNVLG